TLSFALLGALLLTFTLVPAMASVLLRKNVREKHNVFLEFVIRHTLRIYDRCFRLRKLVFGFSVFCLIAGMLSFKLLGTEVLPTLDEGSIYVRATGPVSISLEETKKLSNEMRKVFLSFDEVKQVLSQT